MGYSCRTLLRDTLLRHSSGTLLRDTLVGLSSSSPDTPRTTVVLQGRQFSASSSTGQIAHSPAFRALNTHDLRRGLRAHGTNRTLACISRTRHARSPQRVARQVSKTSVSYETSSKTHASKSAKRAFRTRLPPKVKRKHPWEHTHHAALPSSFAIPAPPNNIRSHANPNGTATFTSTTTHNLTIPCACHENCTSALQSPHEVLRLPRKVTISSHVSFNKICTTPHVWNDFDPFRAHSHPSKSPFQLRLVTKTELRCHTLKRKSQWHGHIQHPKKTTLQALIPMELRRNLRISQNAAPVQRSASRFLRDMSLSCKSQWNSVAN